MTKLSMISGDDRYASGRSYPDISLDELREMGIHLRWLRIADEIGIPAFLTVWRLLDEDPPNTPGSTVYVSMPRFTRYLRFQRNCYIESLASEGCTSLDIKKRIRADLREEVSVRLIDRVKEAARQKRGGSGCVKPG